ncbi:uncharacterized protein LOC118816795 [Colossoma macropomum]|uniref:uncharacterized protein LOC118816795 n=1 Tax=Colossoma macropomum TaxID=42526 RepID=UPI0018646D9D|nr:uncharacterized protein LOC118816795 [Colossoma macropomum]
MTKAPEYECPILVLKIYHPAEFSSNYSLSHQIQKFSTDVDQSDLHTDIRFKDPHRHQPPTPVSEMERPRAALMTLVCVLFSRISGAEVEMRVRPGDDVTLYSDCNVTNSDVGLYYCAIHERKITEDDTGVILYEDVYHYGNRTTRLSLLIPFAQTTPVSDCSVCWKLLVSVCPVCVLFSSLLSSTCVYCICINKTKAEAESGQEWRNKIQSQKSRTNEEVEEDEVCYASLDVRGQKQLKKKKKRVESFDFSTYSEEIGLPKSLMVSLPSPQTCSYHIQTREILCSHGPIRHSAVNKLQP